MVEDSWFYFTRGIRPRIWVYAPDFRGVEYWYWTYLDAWMEDLDREWGGPEKELIYSDTIDYIRMPLAYFRGTIGRSV